MHLREAKKVMRQHGYRIVEANKQKASDVESMALQIIRGLRAISCCNPAAEDLAEDLSADIEDYNIDGVASDIYVIKRRCLNDLQDLTEQDDNIDGEVVADLLDELAEIIAEAMED